MKFLQIILVLISIATTCSAIDRIPVVHVRIDKSIISDVDSVYLMHDFQKTIFTDRYKVSPNQTKYTFSSFDGDLGISIKLKDSSKLLSDSTLILGRDASVIVKRNDSEISFQQYHQSMILVRGIQLIVLILTLLIFKLPIAMLIVRPESKMRFLLDFGKSILIYVVVLILLIVIMQDAFVVAFFPYVILTFLFDLFFLIYNYDGRGKLRPILAAIVINVLFLTIGLLLIFTTMMLFK